MTFYRERRSGAKLPQTFCKASARRLRLLKNIPVLKTGGGITLSSPEICADEDDHTLNDVLPVDIQMHQGQAVGDDTDNEHTDDDTGGSAGTTIHGRSAKHAGCDSICLSTDGGGRLSGFQLRGKDDSCECTEETGEGPHQDLDLLDVDTDRFWSLPAAATV